MAPVISVQNLGKKYILNHQPQERYVSLRDVLVSKTKQFGHKIRHPFKKKNDLTHEEFWALRDINFVIQQGDKVGIIGRNGAGKSTLLKILSRITEPTTGSLKIKGRVASLLEVGTGFHPELTGRENVYLNGAILGMNRNEIKRKFDEIVAFAEIEKFLDTPVKRYSSGMYMRLAFSVAAHLEPEILIVDEVLAVGDAQFQKKCMGKMNEVGSEGRTVLFVSHNIDAIASLCNKGILLHQGEIKCLDTAEIVTQMYMSSMHESEFSIKTCARAKQGGIEIQDVWIEDNSNQPLTTIGMGGSANLCVKFKVNDSLKSKEIDVGFGVDTMDGRRLFTAVASWKRTEIIPKTNDVVVRCKLPLIPLNPNRYLVSTSVTHKGEAWDYAFNCKAFDVVNDSKDYYFKVAKDHGDFSVPYDFDSYDVCT